MTNITKEVSGDVRCKNAMRIVRRLYLHRAKQHIEHGDTRFKGGDILRDATLFLAGFCLYITIECLFRGYSYPLMGVCGGLCVILLDRINDYISWDMDLLLQALCGACLVTAMEIILGVIAKYTPLLPVMWDYSDIPLNIDGIICLPFSIAWMFLSVVAIFLSDAINYYVFEETNVPYYRLFGGRVRIEFPKKKCDAG